MPLAYTMFHWPIHLFHRATPDFYWPYPYFHWPTLHMAWPDPSLLPGTFRTITKKFKLFLGGFAHPPDPPFKSAAVAASASQVRTLEPSRPLSQPPGGGKYLVNGLECRPHDSQFIPNQACRFRNFFLGPIPELFSARFSPHF